VSEQQRHGSGRERWSVNFVRRADKDLERLDRPVRQRVNEGIERLAEGDPSADVRKLKGSDELRLRVGDWRVRFERDANTRQITILRVLPRGRAYKR
jgi:mRNA interferase RelE/StbE